MRLIVSLFLLVIVWPAFAGPLDDLEQYFNATDTLKGEFTQTTLDEDDRVLDVAEGSFWIARPDRFRWHYKTPLEQVLVADGEALWSHDVELEQATVRPLDEVLGAGPAVLLSGTYADIQEAFQVNVLEDGWIQLEVKSEQWDFQSVLMQWLDGIPGTIVVDSGLGQRTVLQLQDVETNADIADDVFRFSPPEGIDVIDAR